MAVKLEMLELLLVTATFCVAATVLFGGNVKLNECGLVDSGLLPVELALSVTGMLSEPADDPMLMKAVLVPDVGAFEPTETVNESGVVPPFGVTVSQLLEETGDMTTLVGVADVSKIVCDGVVEPDCVLNVI